jgi:hypothetical protein
MADYLVSFLNAFVGLRKTIVMLSLLIVSCVFRVKGLITSDNWEGVLKSTVIAYFGSNSIEHYAAMVKERLLANGKKEEVTEIDSHTEEG